MRALLVMNPTATTTTERSRDVLVNALSTELSITAVPTQRRGHAAELAQRAITEEFDVVIALGGDGTVNEIVNGILGHERARDKPAAGGARLPSLAVVPGGSANVFARSLGLPNDPIEATGLLLDALRRGRRRAVSVGRADGRFFTFCAGLGFDAAVVGMVEQRRAAGDRASGPLYVRSAIRHYLASRTRVASAPRIRALFGEGDEETGLLVAVIANTTPWTYLGNRPIRATPDASFESGLDLFGMTSLGMVNTVKQVGRLLTNSARIGQGRGALLRHDLTSFTLVAEAPADFQLDGEHLGQRTELTLTSLPGALDVVL